jgi:hypothetical protein
MTATTEAKPKKVISAAAKAAHAAKFQMKRARHDPSEVRNVRFRSLARKVGANILADSAGDRLNKKMKARIAFLVPRVFALMMRDPKTKSTILLRHVTTFLELMGTQVY